MLTRSLALIALTAVVAGFSATARAVTDEDRKAVYEQFRALFDARDFAGALPVAERLVAMTEEQYGKDERALVNPLANLGTTQLRLGNFPAAEAAYQRAITLLEAQGAPTERQLIVPLHGLGATYLAVRRPEVAATALKRAVDLSRNLDGLYNAAQLDLVGSLIVAYVDSNQLAEAEKEHQYAYRVAETAYGAGDPRMLGPIDDYARWFEFVGRYTTARQLHARALSLAERTSGRGSLATVEALRGIARTYRLEFVYGAEITEAPTSADPFQIGTGQSGPVQVERMNPDGQRALRLALAAIEKQEPVDRRLRGEVLTELGDWFTTEGQTDKAIAAYREAWVELAAAGDAQLLASPRQLAYRPPQTSIARFRGGDIADYDERFVEIEFTVQKTGRTGDVRVLASTAPESTTRAVIANMRKARYAPRFIDGEPVDTPGITHREVVLIRKARPRPG